MLQTVDSTVAREYLNRSCKRLGRPCQNSNAIGSITQPPHMGGRGTLAPSNCFRYCSSRSTNTERSPITCDCGEAHAPSCDSRGRDAKYSSLCDSATLRTEPRTRTWRCKSSHEKTADATGCDSSCALLSLV
jgi:hypothetical protein